MTDDIYIQALKSDIRRLKSDRLTLCMIVLVLIGLFIWQTSHADLKLAGRMDPDPVTIAMLKATGMGDAFTHIWDTQGSRSWFSFACAEDTIRWPRGQNVWLRMKDGSETPALEVWAVTEEGRGIRLGDRGMLLTDQVKRRRFRGGPVSAVLFAAFRSGIDPDSVIEVRRSP